MNYEERRKIAALVEKEIEMSKKLNESSSEYLNLIKQIKSLHNEISTVRNLYVKQQEKVRKAQAGIITMTADELEIEKEKEKVLARNLKHLEKTTE
jgi:septal ring factor EnvC (AmiA/AmiB activator)